MSSRSQKDKEKQTQERHQAILSGLLKEEDNKYCVDCDAKGPRWASWNLGIFLCIRCAGIHRNLGVHISKVKSVNLDTWTAEQVAMMQEMGNSRARAVYEAYIPDNFRRPQTDSALEHLIRQKYEQKKYIAKEWVPPQPKVPVIEDDKKDKKKASKPRGGALALNSTTRPPSSKPVNVVNGDITSKPKQAAPPPTQAPAKPAPSVDLLGLDTPSPSQPASANTDLFGDFLGANSQPSQPAQTQAAQPQSNGESLLKDLDDTGSENKSSAKDSIMALYGNTSQQQQMFGVPGGVYMPQQQQGYGMMGMPQGNPGMPGMMPAQQMGMGNMQQGMMGMQQQQPHMMMGMPGQNNMMPGQNMMMQNQMNMYNMQQQQQQQYMQQVQNQMAAMNMGNPNMGGYSQQQGTVAAGSGGWGGQSSGHTLANNLWQ